MTRNTATEPLASGPHDLGALNGLSDQPRRLAYTLGEFAQLIGLNYQQVVGMVRRGQIKSVAGPSRQRLIPFWAAEEFLQIPDGRKPPD